MAVTPSYRILRAEHKSSDGVNWRVDIHDSLAASENTRECYLSSAGITFKTEGREEIYNFINPMTVEFELMINNQDLEDTIESFALSAGQRYYVFIYKETTRHFVGMITNDTTETEDAPWPYKYRIQAIDGLSTLKDQPYDNNGVAFTGYEYISRIITKCLGFMPTAGFYDNSTPPTTPYLLTTVIDWYENDMADTLTTDSLEQTRVRQEVFDKRESYTDEPDPMSCWEVLEKICLRYAARLFYADGGYWIMQPDVLLSSATFTTYRYLRGATNNTVSNTSGNEIDIFCNDNPSATAAPLTGGVFTAYQAYKEIILKSTIGSPDLNFDGIKWSGDGIYTNSTKTTDNVTADDIVVEDIDTTGEDVRIKFRCRAVVKNYDTSMNDGDIYADTNFVSAVWGTIAVQFEIGGKYLKRNLEYSYRSLREQDWNGWVDTTTSSVSWMSPDIFKTSGEIKEIECTIVSDFIPDVGTSDLTISFSGYSSRFAYNDPLVQFPNNFEWEVNDIQVTLLVGNNIFTQTREVKHIATNSNANIRSKEYSINFADAVSKNQRNQLEVLTSTGWIRSSTWNYKGTNYNINDLTVFVMASLQKLPIKVRNGGFAKIDAENYNLLSYLTYSWMPLSWTRETQMDEAHGTFVVLYQDRTNISLSEETVELIVRDPDKTAVGNTIAPSLSMYNGPEGILITQYIAAGSVSSIDIVAPGYDAFKADDIIRIIDPYTGASEVLTVTSDLSSTDTSLSVSGTLNNAYYAGAQLMLDLTSMAAKVPRATSIQSANWDNQTGASIDVTTPTNGDSITLPDSDTLTDAEINKRLKVWRNGVKQRYRGDYSGAFTDYGYKIDDDNDLIYFYPALEDEDIEIENLVI